MSWLADLAFEMFKIVNRNLVIVVGCLLSVHQLGQLFIESARLTQLGRRTVVGIEGALTILILGRVVLKTSIMIHRVDTLSQILRF